MHAEERGLLSLDTDVRALVAERAGFSLAAPGSAPISLRALVSHTSPIRDTPFYFCSYYLGSERGRHETMFKTWGARVLPELAAQGFACDETAPVDLGGFLRAYLSADGVYYTPDNFSEQPGPAYSNVGAALAGHALGLKAGVSLAEYSRRHLFDPLRMAHTSWEGRWFRAAELATPYLWDEERGAYQALPQYEGATWPDGGLRSSARDMGRFLAMVMRGGELEGKRVLRERSVTRMLSPLVSEGESETAVFWQLGRDPAGRRLIGHDGSDLGATTFMFYLPDEKLGFVLLMNADTDHALEVLDPALGATLLEAAGRLHARRR